MVPCLAPFIVYRPLDLGLFKFIMAEKDIVIPFKDDSDDKINYSPSAVALSEYLNESVRNILSNVTDEKFVSIYKACYKAFEKRDDVERPSLSGSSVEGRKYHSQFNDIIMKTISETIEETVSKMDGNLKELEELKAAQSDSTVQWRPPGSAPQHMIPFEYVCEKEKKKELEGRIDKEQEALGILKTRLIQKRNKAKELHEELLSLIDEIRRIVAQKINNEQLE